MDLSQKVQKVSTSQEKKRNEKVRKIKEQLKVKKGEARPLVEKIKTEIKNIKFPDASSIIWMPILIGILSYLICCFSLCEKKKLAMGQSYWLFPFWCQRKLSAGVRVILKRYRGTARYEKGFKGPRRKVSPELDSWLNSDQFWLQAHFCSSKDKKVRIISVKAKIPLPSCKSYYLAMKSIDIITIFSLQK